MAVGCCICNFFKRSLLYQILIIIATLKLRNAWRYNKDFVERIRNFVESINLPEKLLNYLPKNSEYTHKGFLIYLIVIASFSILNFKIFKFLCGLACIKLGFLYHNPIPKIQDTLKQNKKFTFSLETLEENLPELEFILYLCIAFAMIGDSFAEKACPIDKDKKKDPIEPLAEIQKEKPVDDKKQNKKGNKDNKNKGKNKKKKE